MRIICAGLPKTGTSSMAKALQILGYKTYDYPEHLSFHLEQWSQVFLKKKQPDFLSMYRKVDAVTDMPPNFFYKEILETFSDAKVILTERDSEDVWIESWFRQVEQFKGMTTNPFGATLLTLSPTLRKRSEIAYHCRSFVLGTGSYDKGSSFLLKKKYREYNEQVKASVPSDQLLVYNVKQGWQPLCEFLGCDIPSCPFPKENVKGALIAERLTIKKAFSSPNGPKIFREMMIRISLFVLLVGIVLMMFNVL